MDENSFKFLLAARSQHPDAQVTEFRPGSGSRRDEGRARRVVGSGQPPSTARLYRRCNDGGVDVSGVVSGIVLGAFTELSQVERGDRWPRLFKLDDVVEALLLHFVDFGVKFRLHLHGLLQDGAVNCCSVSRRVLLNGHSGRPIGGADCVSSFALKS